MEIMITPLAVKWLVEYQKQQKRIEQKLNKPTEIKVDFTKPLDFYI